jgi:hypothetical protein
MNTLDRGTQVLQQQMPQYMDRNNFQTPTETKRNKDTFNTTRLVETSMLFKTPQTNNVDSSFFKPSKEPEASVPTHAPTGPAPDIFLPFGLGTTSDIGKYRDLNEQSPVYEWTLPDAVLKNNQVSQVGTTPQQTQPSSTRSLPIQLIKGLANEPVVFSFNKKLTFSINSVELLNKLFNDNQMMIKWTGQQFPSIVTYSKLSVFTDTTYTGTSFKDYMYWHENNEGQQYYLVEIPVEAKINDEKGHFEGRVGWIISDQVGFIPKNLAESTNKMKFGNIEIKTSLFKNQNNKYFQTRYSMTANNPIQLNLSTFILNARNAEPIISDVSTDLPPLEVKPGTIMYLRTDKEFIMFGFWN